MCDPYKEGPKPMYLMPNSVDMCVKPIPCVFYAWLQCWDLSPSVYYNEQLKQIQAAPKGIQLRPRSSYYQHRQPLHTGQVVSLCAGDAQYSSENCNEIRDPPCTRLIYCTTPLSANSSSASSPSDPQHLDRDGERGDQGPQPLLHLVPEGVGLLQGHE